jgi:hypothetical protein
MFSTRKWRVNCLEADCGFRDSLGFVKFSTATCDQDYGQVAVR